MSGALTFLDTSPSCTWKMRVSATPTRFLLGNPHQNSTFSCTAHHVLRSTCPVCLDHRAGGPLRASLRCPKGLRSSDPRRLLEKSSLTSGGFWTALGHVEIKLGPRKTREDTLLDICGIEFDVRNKDIFSRNRGTIGRIVFYLHC